jgi:hypothetical protein
MICARLYYLIILFLLPRSSSIHNPTITLNFLNKNEFYGARLLASSPTPCLEDQDLISGFTPIGGSINVRRFERTGHVVRIDDERMVKRVFLGNPGGRTKLGRPRLRWLDCVEDDLKTLGVRRWRKRVEDREEWAIILKEAMVKL